MNILHREKNKGLSYVDNTSSGARLFEIPNVDQQHEKENIYMHVLHGLQQFLQRDSWKQTFAKDWGFKYKATTGQCDGSCFWGKNKSEKLQKIACGLFFLVCLQSQTMSGNSNREQSSNKVMLMQFSYGNKPMQTCVASLLQLQEQRRHKQNSAADKLELFSLHLVGPVVHVHVRSYPQLSGIQRLKLSQYIQIGVVVLLHNCVCMCFSVEVVLRDDSVSAVNAEQLRQWSEEDSFVKFEIAARSEHYSPSGVLTNLKKQKTHILRVWCKMNMMLTHGCNTKYKQRKCLKNWMFKYKTVRR